MIKFSLKLAGTLAMGAALVLLSAEPSLAQRAPVPCSAFSRSGAGGWTVLAPVMLDFGNRLYSPTVGTTFAAGSMQNGIEMTDVLDRQCGNR
jgi:NaMN:DMB phosphoribosyltransferase